MERKRKQDDLLNPEFSKFLSPASNFLILGCPSVVRQSKQKHAVLNQMIWVKQNLVEEKRDTSFLGNLIWGTLNGKTIP